MVDVVGRGTVLAGRYRVLDPLPTDLDGVDVWQATDQILDRGVRVRVLGSGAVAPALDAARRAALVTDPRLVRVLDVGTHEGVGYVITEQITGVTLAQLVERGPLTPEQARAVVGEAAAALEVARRRGVHHLALRPSVVHVSTDGRVLVSGLALDAALVGSPVGDARATSRADTVDLVRVLYTALTGRWPMFHDDTTPVRDLQPAPVLDGSPVPPAEIVMGVPNDLDTLCSVTLGPYEDGPHSPAELVRELEPWGEIRIGQPVEQPTAAYMATDPAATMIAPPVAPPQPVRVARQSVRAAFDELPPGAARPGTPPPAAPARSTGLPAASWTDTQTGAFAPPEVPASLPPVAAGRPPAHPQRTAGPPAAIPPGGDDGQGWGPGAPTTGDPFPFADDEQPRERKFDPTALVLVVVGVVLLIGLVFAASSLFAGTGDQTADPAGGTSTQPQDPGTDESPSAEESPEPSEPAVSTDPPAIASIRSIDPNSPEGEKEELVPLAIDNDPSTFWYTFTYNRPDFGGLKPAVGLEVTLRDTASVSSVTLGVNGTGGNVEVRATTMAAPTEGDLLASGTLGAQTVLTFDEPVDTSTIVLWFTELPTNSEGKFRLEVNDVKVG